MAKMVPKEPGEAKRDHRMRVLAALKDEKRQSTPAKDSSGKGGKNKKSKGGGKASSKDHPPARRPAIQPQAKAGWKRSEPETSAKPGAYIDRLLKDDNPEEVASPARFKPGQVAEDPYGGQLRTLSQKMDASLEDLVQEQKLDGAPLDDADQAWTNLDRTRGPSAERDANRARDIWSSGKRKGKIWGQRPPRPGKDKGKGQRKGKKKGRGKGGHRK